MRITVSLDDRLMKELTDVTRANTKSDAIRLAVFEFIRWKKLEGLKALSGKFHIADRWQKSEKQELRGQEKHRQRLHGYR